VVYEDSRIYTASWMLVTRRDFAMTHGGLCQSVLTAYRTAIRRIRALAAGAVAHDPVISTLPPATRLEMSRIIYNLSLDWSLLISYRLGLAWARAAGYPDAGRSPGLIEAIHPRPLAEINSRAVSLQF